MPSIGLIAVELDSATIVYANDAAAKLLEAKSKDELIGLNIHSFVIEERKSLFQQRLVQIKNGKSFTNIEVPIITLKNNLSWLRIDYLPFEYQNKLFMLVGGVNIDKDIELRNSFQRRIVYESILSDLYSTIAQSFESNSTLTNFLPLLQNRLGAKRSALFIRKTMDEHPKLTISIPQDKPAIEIHKTVLLDAIKKGGVIQYNDITLLVIAPAQTPRIIIALEKAKIEHFDNLLEELRRYLELWLRALTLYEKLEQSQTQFLKILDFLPTAVVVIDNKQKVAFWNHTAEQMFSLSAKDVIGKDALSLFNSEYAQRRARAALSQIKAGKPIINRIWDIYIPGRGICYYRVFAVPLKNMQPLEAIVIINDDTEHRKQEAMLEEEGRIAALGELAAGIAHEINNPLQGIVSIAELLKHRLENSNQADLVKFAEVILRESSRIGKIIENLLQLSTPESGEFAEYQLNQVVKEAIELIKSSFDAKGIVLKTQLAENLPSIAGFKHATFQIVLNLLVNAKNILVENKINKCIVKVSTVYNTKQSNTPVELHVEDSGPGVDESIKERIFNPFFTTRRPQGGSGLGLSIALRLVRQQGGDILVSRSAELGGAKFTVLLPVRAPQFNKLGK